MTIRVNDASIQKAEPKKKTLVKLVILGYQSTDGFNKNQCCQPTKVKKVGRQCWSALVSADVIIRWIWKIAVDCRTQWLSNALTVKHIDCRMHWMSNTSSIKCTGWDGGHYHQHQLKTRWLNIPGLLLNVNPSQNHWQYC